MKKLLGLLIVTILSVNTVMAEEFKVAVVDVPQVVNASAQVQALKKDQQAKAQEIVKFIEKARKDVAAISDAKKKQTAEEKFNKELVAKKEKMDKDYANKLKAIDESISAQITAKAKEKGYNVVLSKGIVLYGGDDLTAEMVKVIK